MTTAPLNPNPDASSRPTVPGPPTKHQLALMIWLAVFPTLSVLNLALGDWLRTLTPLVRTFVLATIAVPIVIHGFDATAAPGPQAPVDPHRKGPLRRLPGLDKPQRRRGFVTSPGTQTVCRRVRKSI